MSFQEDIKNPFNILMLALAIIGVAMGFYFYYFPRIVRKIVFTASGSSLIYDSSVESPNVSFIDSSNQKIVTNTYLTSFTFRNAGSEPIEPNDVRRPITVDFPGIERILDYKITESTDQDVSGFRLLPVMNGSTFVKALQLYWNHFDPKKTVSFQVIHCQSNQPNTFVTADIVGVNELIRGDNKVANIIWLFMILTLLFVFLTSVLMVAIAMHLISI
jgi:hypothetical protein